MEKDYNLTNLNSSPTKNQRIFGRSLLEREKIKEWQDIPELDAQIRTIIKKPKKEGKQWEVEIGLQESLGEQGGDILTEYFDSKPTLEEIKNIIINDYKQKKIDVNKEVAFGITAKSGRDEMIEGAIDKVLSKVEVCSECGKPVSPGSGRYVNRVCDFDSVEERKTLGRPYPGGDFICPMCDGKTRGD